MSNKTDYTEEFIAHALAVLKADNNNAKRVATRLGIPRTTLRQWAGRAKSETARPKKVAPEVQASVDGEMAERLDAAFLMVTEPELVKSKLDKASLRDLLISSDIATRGRSFLRGGPTSRTESLKVSLVDPSSLRDPALTVIEGGRKAS